MSIYGTGIAGAGVGVLVTEILFNILGARDIAIDQELVPLNTMPWISHR